MAIVGSIRAAKSRGGIIASGAIAVGLAVLVAAPAGAITWNRKTVVNTPGASLQDAAIHREDIAVVWRQPGAAGSDLWARTSRTVGITFDPAEVVAPESRQAEVVICGEDVWVAYARDYSKDTAPARWLIDAATRDLDDSGFSDVAVSFADEGTHRDPDVACGGQRLFVSWLQRVGGFWHLLVNHALRSSPDFGSTAPQDLGEADVHGGQPVLAGVGNRAYAAFSRDGKIFFHRWRVGGAPGHVVTDLGGRRIGPSGTGPRIAALGNKVVVAWSDCGDVRARVSNDRGATWGPIQDLFFGACGSEFGGSPASVAIQDRILVGYHWISGDLAAERVISTRNDFASFTDRRLFDNGQGFVVGVIAYPKAFALAAVNDEGDRVRYYRQ